MMASQQKSKLASKFITLCYDNFPIQREFVFSMKGRPFSMLSSQSLPVPSVSLIDFNLVNDLNLKMSDLQCAKFSFGGQKLRILGRISQTVQTITDGVITGTVHIRANVVEDLRKTFDCHSIAGKKMTEMLSQEIAATVSPPASPPSSATSSAEQSPAPPKSPRRSRGSQAPATTEVSVSTLTGAPDTFGSPVTISSKSRAVFTGSPGSYLPTDSERAAATAARRSLPPLSTPKPLGKHYRTPWRGPQPREEPGPGIPRRTVPLRPDSSHFYARVVSNANKLSRKGRLTGMNLVELEYKDAAGFIRSVDCNTPAVLRGIKVGDPVLFKRYRDGDLAKATEDGHLDTNPIMVIYSKEEEKELTANHGAFFPEVPPECLPGGYYG